MNTSSTFSLVMMPLKALWRWLMVEPGSVTIFDPRSADLHPSAAGKAQLATPQGYRSEDPIIVGKQAVRRRPVRVVQVLEAGQTHAQTGRLRISGRMADVCAELDRLAAREALLH